MIGNGIELPHCWAFDMRIETPAGSAVPGHWDWITFFRYD